MHRSRPAGPRRAALALLLLLAACDGGAADPIVHPDDLQMAIVRGGGQRASVRPFGDQPADSLAVHTPVVVRISLATDLEAEEEGVAGPAGGVRLPPVTVQWRTLDPFCQVVHATTQVEPGSDTTVNRYVRPTRSGICRVVAEATADGRPVGRPDTAAIHFDPGPPARMEVRPIVLMQSRGVELVEFTPGVYDAHGNLVSGLRFTYELTGGAPVFYFEQAFALWIRSTGEGIGEVTARHGALSGRVPVWALNTSSEFTWRLSWECYGMDRPDGVRVDSVHFSMDPASLSHGAFSPRGLAMTLTGSLVRREWHRGQPVRETRMPDAQVFAARKPRLVEWSPGQAAPASGTGYVGGTLCQPDPGGAPWSRTSPVRLIRPGLADLP